MENDLKSIIFAGELDGKGGVRTLDSHELDDMWLSSNLMWVHLNRNAPETEHWLRTVSGLHPVVIEALLEEDTRPRSLLYDSGLLLISRGVNLNAGADPEDMIVLKTWIQNNNIITLRSQKSFSTQDIIDALLAGNGPCNSSEFIVEALERQLMRIAKVVDTIQESIDTLDKISNDTHNHIESQLKDICEKSLAIRRYLAAQKDVIGHISTMAIPWLNPHDKMRIQEMADRTAHYVEELEFVQDKANCMQDEINTKYARDLNSKIYLLAIVSIIFLPLGFITGLLGVNLTGIPMAENPKAFYTLCCILLSIAGVTIGILKKNKWI